MPLIIALLALLLIVFFGLTMVVGMFRAFYYATTTEDRFIFAVSGTGFLLAILGLAYRAYLFLLT